MNRTPPQRMVNLSIIMLALIATVTALKLTSTLVLPVLIALFIAAMVQPIMRKIKEFVPESLSIVVLVILLGLFMSLAMLLFAANVQAISAKIPEYTQRLHHMSAGVLKYAQAHGIQITWEQIGAQKGASWALKFLTSGLTSVLSLSGQMFLIIFVLIFAMLELQAFRTKFQLALGDRVSGEVVHTIHSISERIQQYALTKTSVSLLTGICTWLVATLFGVDFAIFWGMLAFLLNYIPTIGSMIAVFPPVIIAFLQFGGWYHGVGVLAGLSAVQMLIGNILEPKMMGRSMRLSPLVVFLSMVFWGWLWDIAGMVMAVPLTVAIKIVCQHIEHLHPVAIFLGDGDVPPDYKATIDEEDEATAATADATSTKDAKDDANNEPGTTTAEDADDAKDSDGAKDADDAKSADDANNDAETADNAEASSDKQDADDAKKDAPEAAVDATKPENDTDENDAQEEPESQEEQKAKQEDKS